MRLDFVLNSSDRGDKHTITLPERSEIPYKDKWETTDIFPSDQEWENTFKTVAAMIPELGEFQNKIGESANNLLNFLNLREEIYELLGKLYLYAGLRNDEDSTVPKYQAFKDRANSLRAQFQEKTAFYQPEILAIPKNKLISFLKEYSELSIYRHHFEDIQRVKDHVLPLEQETLLAMSGEMGGGAYNIFSMFNNADIKFPTIKDEQNQDVEVTKGRFQKFMESPNRRVREDAFMALYQTYSNWTNTLAATLSTAIKRNIFYSRARKYEKALQAALYDDNIPQEIYENVINSVKNNLLPLHKYMKLRRKILDVDELKPWDLHVPLVSKVKFDIPYEESVEYLLEAFEPLGGGYLDILKNSFNSGWIDVFENKGKRSGAYSWSVHGVHPFVLLNYNNMLHDLFTLAHEMGHAMHSYYTQKSQPIIYSGYTIFVAEVASTLNEALLRNHLLKTTTDKMTKLYLLSDYADHIRGTIYNQTLFAELEKIIHETVENGEALTAEYLDKLTGDLYSRYLGPDFSPHPLLKINWCRVPHFYYNFYVYQYVTGFSAAASLSQKILTGDTSARDAYIDFLSKGSSNYSVDLLMDAGVDMSKPEPIEAATELFDDILNDIEALIN